MRRWMKERREACGLTLKQAGEAIGISESYYKLIEDGVRQKRLDITMADKIGKLYSMTLKEIFEQEAV